jgi:hypothetical protein
MSFRCSQVPEPGPSVPAYLGLRLPRSKAPLLHNFTAHPDCSTLKNPKGLTVISKFVRSIYDAETKNQS